MFTTRRLVLRRASEKDAADLNNLDNDADVMRWINGGVETTMEHTRAETVPLFMSFEVAEKLLGFWIVQSIESDFLGWVSMRPTDYVGEVSIGYRLKKSAWGHGYATESMAALIDAAMESETITRVIANTFEKNTASMKVMEKLGMKFNRRYRLTSDDIAQADTSIQESDEPWDGDEVEYVLDAGVT